MSSRRVTSPSLIPIALGITLVLGCANHAPEAPEPLASGDLDRLAARWAAEFSPTSEDVDRLAEVAARYVAEVPPVHAAQLAELYGAPAFTREGMREVVASANNRRGRYDLALAALDDLVAEAPEAMPRSQLEYLRALNVAGVSEREGVLVTDAAARELLIRELTSRRPDANDRWSQLYAYHLGTAHFAAGHTAAALAAFLPLLDELETIPRPTAQLAAPVLGSALNMTVKSLRAEGELATADTYLDRLVRFDDAHGLDYAGRRGTNPNPTAAR